MAERKKLTDKQKIFLDVLFAEAGGDVVMARNLAGYSHNTSPYVVMKGLQEEIGGKLKESLGTIGSIRAYKQLLDVLEGSDDPLGRKERITVARDLLDRAGHKGTDKVEITAPDALFILPPKE